MANRTDKGVSAAEFLRILERREKKFRVKQLLCADPFEARMYQSELLKAQKFIKRLKSLSGVNKSAGISAAAEIM